MDCPEDIQTYIHRVGRTARFTNAGKAFTILAPSEEEGMKALLKEAKIPVRKIQLNPKQQQRSIKGALQALLSKDTELKGSAQKAVVSYIRSIHLQVIG
jgi:ATP-dependent RNA helicase DDX10/DBP4